LKINKEIKGVVGMGTTDFLVVYIVFIDHVMYVLAENRA
jgi:hypothetical protein